MDIKKLRIKRGMTQSECAAFLGISRRSYQSLESADADRIGAKYLHYCELLNEVDRPKSGPESAFRLNVLVGDELRALRDGVRKWHKRRCYARLRDYIENDYRGKVCILYGLRRTGKTTMLCQLLDELDLSKTAYIKAAKTNHMGDLVKDINVLKSRGIVNYLIDEATLLPDFINAAGTLSDIYAALGLKIVLSGTDSLGFAFADMDELYDRNVMIHTSYIGFGEFCEVLGDKSIDEYIEFGGTLKAENMGFDDPDFRNDEVAFQNDESTRKYIDSAICRNIQRSLENDQFGNRFAGLSALHENGQLINAINRIIDDMNHRFLLSVVEREFHSSDLGSARGLLLRSQDPQVQTVLYDIDEKRILSTMKEILDLREKEEQIPPLTQFDVDQIKQYLRLLDLIRDIEIIYDNGQRESYTVFTQPGMRFAITKALVFSLLKDSRFAALSSKQRQAVVEKIFQDVKGRMMEDIVLLETKTKNPDKDVFQHRFVAKGEYDMVVYDPRLETVSLFEIKHSTELAFADQTRHLRSKEMLDAIETRFGTIENRCVLYRGASATIEGIRYQNVEAYLKAL